MLFHFLSIISLVRGAKGGEDVPIPHCNKQVTVGRDVRQRPTVDPQLCARMDTPACDAIFDIKGRPVDADGIAATIQSHSNPNVDYMIPVRCTEPALKTLAEKTCPSRCAFCCLTKQYNCINGKYMPKMM
ncbi:unnamed protein product [Dracunculus medinensis]|uniref:ShKT domain-containing protein n=1 Tax=Dracunculus medinensis TaxID=318479 RepID=A0A0N4UNW4_DRAME|nr:unnamed protein product [Dracunculus medinensis]